MTILEFLHQFVLHVCQYRCSIIQSFHAPILCVAFIHKNCCMSHQRSLNRNEIDSVACGLHKFINWYDVVPLLVFEVFYCFS